MVLLEALKSPAFSLLIRASMEAARLRSATRRWENSSGITVDAAT